MKQLQALCWHCIHSSLAPSRGPVGHLRICHRLRSPAGAGANAQAIACTIMCAEDACARDTWGDSMQRNILEAILEYIGRQNATQHKCNTMQHHPIQPQLGPQHPLVRIYTRPTRTQLGPQPPCAGIASPHIDPNLTPCKDKLPQSDPIASAMSSCKHDPTPYGPNWIHNHS